MLSREPQVESKVTELNAVSQWRREEADMVCVRAAMDSGALDPVAPPSMAPGVLIQESPGSNVGQLYGGATGHKIPNMGEQQIVGPYPEAQTGR